MFNLLDGLLKQVQLPTAGRWATVLAASAVLLACAAWHAAGQAALPAGGGGPGSASRAADGPGAARATAQELETRYSVHVQPLLKRYCFDCHGDGRQHGSVNFDDVRGLAGLQADRDTWHSSLKQLHAHFMPPPDKPQPTADERRILTEWIGDALSWADCSAGPDPGRGTLRRLNRTEYANTLRDLFNTEFKLAGQLPADDSGYGFDNIADVLSVSPLLAEKYLAIAEQVIAEVVPPPVVQRRTVNLAGSEFTSEPERASSVVGRSARMLFSEGALTHRHMLEPGSYELRIHAWGDQAGPELPQLELRVNDRRVNGWEIKSTEVGKPQVVRVRVTADRPATQFSLHFLNDFFEPGNPNPKRRDRNLGIVRVEIDGPLPQAGAPAKVPSAAYAALFARQPAGKADERRTAEENIRRFASRAYRRPVSGDELARLMKLYDETVKQSGRWEEGVGMAATACLVSPHFLFLVERPPAATRPDQRIGRIGDFELASRLSYFLWSSMPDDTLFELAGQGLLQRDDVLAAQVRRMLADPRAEGLIENFTGQWLHLRNLDEADPGDMSAEAFEALRRDMRTEALMFIQHMLDEDRPLIELIQADYSFLNQRLAEHYGVPGVRGDRFRKVRFIDGRRGGVLTMAAILTVTSNPTRTNPVKRGQFVLEQILGTPTPPPPPEVPQLPESPAAAEQASLRERLVKHREDPACNVCHAQLDPLGFAFENYDAIGRWRDVDGRHRIDAAGELPDGSRFADAAELKRVLAARSAQVQRTLAEKLLTYALGRGLEHFDACTVDDILRVLNARGPTLHNMIQAIVASEAFRSRRIPETAR